MSEDSSNRIVDLINFFAAHPTESFTLSEVVDHLSLSLGSAHRALKTLTEARYLARHPKHKTYALGLALVAIGQAALERHPAVNLAHDEMTRLTADLGLQCVATAVVDDELLSLAKTGTTPADQGIRRVGERRPFIPPLGFGHIAWSKPEAIETYLSRGPGHDDEEMRRFMLESLAVIRKRGYAMAANGPVLKSVWQMIWEHAANFRDEDYWLRMRRTLGELSKDEFQLLSLDAISKTRIGYISAPVFSAAGEVVLSVSLSGFADRLDAATVFHCIERLCTATANVTSATNGRMPRAS